VAYDPKYPRINRRVVRGIRAFYDSHPWRDSLGGRTCKLETLVGTAAQAMRVPTPRVTIEPHAGGEGGLGRFDETCNTIVLPKFSLTAALYQLARISGKSDRQAKAWTASALFLARPQTFERMVRNRSLRFVKVRELGETSPAPATAGVSA
jgi:hypothetical protein